MAKKATASKGRDPGVTIRVPLETVLKLRQIAADLPANPLVSADEMVAKLAHRALAIGVESARLVPRE